MSDKTNCKTCGASGRMEFGNGDEGPISQDWIGETKGKQVCYNCDASKEQKND